MSDEACYADDIADYRWEGFSLAEKYAWMQTGEGTAAVQPAVTALRELSTRLVDSDRTLRDKLHRLGVTWAGAASDAAAGATDRLADWVGGVGRTTTVGGGNVDTYGSSFAEMKPRIPPPVDVPKGSFGYLLDGATGGFSTLVGLQTEYSRQVEAAQAADQQANAALNAHQAATRQALSTFPVTAAPPASTIGTGAAIGAAIPAAGRPVGQAAGTPGSRAATPGSRPAAPTGGPTVGGRAGSRGPVVTGERGAAEQRTRTSSASAGEVPPAPGQPPTATDHVGPGPAALPPVGSQRARGLPAGPGAAPARYGQDAAPARYGQDAPTARYGQGPTAARYGDHSGPLPPRAGVPSGPPGAVTDRAPHSQRSPAGQTGTPFGMGGAGPGGSERLHRNQTFIPSDEPFQVEFTDVSPPVLGVRTEEDP